MSLYNRLKQRPDSSGPDRKLTAAQFLNKQEGVKGYTNSDEFLTYLMSLRESEVDDLTRFFEHVKLKVRCENHLRLRNDRGERPYRFPKFLKSNAADGTKIIPEAGMGKFLDDYAEGIVSISFTLDELYEEAANV